MKNNIIEHPIRNEIYNYIRNNPSNINEIMKAINIGSNQALWHLSCLEKFRFTRSKKIENQRIIFELRYIQGMSLSEISEHLNVPQGTALSSLYHTRKKIIESIKQNNISHWE